jgi:hypothetical protein
MNPTSLDMITGSECLQETTEELVGRTRKLPLREVVGCVPKIYEVGLADMRPQSVSYWARLRSNEFVSLPRPTLHCSFFCEGQDRSV